MIDILSKKSANNRLVDGKGVRRKWFSCGKEMRENKNIFKQT